MSYAFKGSSSQRVDFHLLYEVKTWINTTYILQGESEYMFIYNNGDHTYMTYMYIHVTYPSSTLNVFFMHKLVKLVDFLLIFFKGSHFTRPSRKTTKNNLEHLHTMHQDTQWTPKHI